MKKSNKILFVLATALLAFAVGCNNPNVSTPSDNSSDTTSSHTHVYGDWAITKSPTETEKGTVERVCSEDNEKEVVEIPALSDKTFWTEKSSVPPTHELDGSKTYTCKYGDVTVVLPHGEHEFGAWKITKEPTVNATGTAERVCAADEKKETVELPVLTDASWTKTVTKEVSHTEDGEITYTCTYGTVVVVVPHGEHVFGAWAITKEPTVDATGTAERVCDADGAKDAVTLPVLTDTSVWSMTIIKEATHTEDGKKSYSSVYGTVEVVVPHGNHVYGAWKITKDPTADATGTAERVCDADGNKDVVTLPVLTDESVWSMKVTKEATHIEDGEATYSSVYGTVVVVIPHGEHVFSNWEWVVLPTETTVGSQRRTCAADGVFEDREVPVLLNECWTAGEVVDATCTTPSTRTYTSDYGTVTVILSDALDHNRDSYSITQNPTLEATGLANHVCSRCDDVEEVEVPALSDEEVWDVLSTTPATHFAPGKVVYTSVYGDVEVELPQEEHDYSYWRVGEDATLGSVATATEACADGALGTNTVSAKLPDSISLTLNKQPLPGSSHELSEGDDYILYTSDSHGWYFDAETNSYKNGNTGVSNSSSYMWFRAANDGVLTFDYYVQSESASFDYFSYKGTTNKYGGTSGVSGSVTYDYSANSEFSLWYKKDNSGDKGIDGVVITNMKFVPNDMSPSTINFNLLSFDTGTEETVTSYFVFAGSPVGKLPTPTREGYAFVGWYDGDTLVDGNSIFSSSKTLTAQWAEAAYVTFVLNNGEDDLVIPFTKGTAIDVENPVKEGFTFKGWYLDAAFENAFDVETLITENTTLYAKFEENAVYVGTYYGTEIWGNSSGNSAKYTLTIDGEGNMTGVKTGKVTEYDPVTQKVTYVSGAETKWFYFDAETKLIAGLYRSSNDIDTDFYILSAAGSDSDFKMISSYAVATSNPLNDSSSRGYYARLIRVNTVAGVKDILLYGNHIYTDISITNVNGDTLAITDVKTSKTCIVKDKDGNVVVSVAATDTDFNKSSTKTVDLDNYYGTYTWGDKTVVLDGVGNITVDGVSGTYNAVSGKDYGFDVYLNDSTEYYEMTLTAEGVATLNKPMVTISFNTNGGEAISEVSVNKNVEYALPTPVKNGSVFKGWYFDEALTESVSSEFVPDGNEVLYAKWADNVVVTCHLNNGSDVAPVIFGNGDPAEIAKPKYPGYAFKGWYTTETFEDGTEWVSGTVVTENVDIYAKWEVAPIYNKDYVGEMKLTGTKANGDTSGTSGYSIALSIDEEGYGYATSYPFRGGVYIDNYDSTTGRAQVKLVSPVSVSVPVGTENNNGETISVVTKNIGADAKVLAVVPSSLTHKVVSYTYDSATGDVTITLSGTTSSSSVYIYYYSATASASIYNCYIDSVTGMIVMADTSGDSSKITSLFVISPFEGNNAPANFKSSYWNGGATRAVTFTSGENVYNIFVHNDVVYFDVSFKALDDSAVTADALYNSENGVKVCANDGTIIAQFGYNGTTLVYLDGLQGTYVCDDDKTVVLDGINKITIDGVEGTYEKAADDATYTVSAVCGNVYYEVTLNGTTATVVKPMVLVTYNTNGGDELEAESKNINIGYKLPTPTREGFVFKGWYLDEGLTVAAKDEIVPTEALTLYAKWAAKVTLTVNYSGELDNVVYNFGVGDTVNLDDYIPVYTNGKVFDGWYLDATFETPAELTSINESTVVYCKWVNHGPYVVTGSALYTPIYNAETNTWETTNNGINNSNSSLKIEALTTITITCKYYAQSEEAKKWDFLSVKVNNVTVATSGGPTNTNPVEYTVTLNAGDTLEFYYVKDGNNSKGEDKAYIIDLAIDGTPITKLD
ncbi:MAG: InlB B-repeat-containing protein [Bacillales bacterium]|nr:InlB B-repeat-containing protein [Bacillales bacterium]